MEIILTKQESEDYFHSALCNGLGYMGGYGLELEYKKEEYKAAVEQIKSTGKSPCFEDVLLEILKMGGSLTFVDIECEGEYTRTISLNDVHERVAKTPIYHLVDMIKENDDANTADVIIQTVFFEDVIFG